MQAAAPSVIAPPRYQSCHVLMDLFTFFSDMLWCTESCIVGTEYNNRVQNKWHIIHALWYILWPLHAKWYPKAEVSCFREVTAVLITSMLLWKWTKWLPFSIILCTCRFNYIDSLNFIFLQIRKQGEQLVLQSMSSRAKAASNLWRKAGAQEIMSALHPAMGKHI